MNVIFAGYRKWSFAILRNLLQHHSSKWNISHLVTIQNPEFSIRKLTIPAVYVDPTKLSQKEILNTIIKCNPHVMLFYGWSWMIPKELYQKYVCLILHPSPLPKYRGGSPIQHQIINGEVNSAITLLQVNDILDGGSIYSQSSISLKGNMDAIFRRIGKTGSKDTIRVLDQIANNTQKIYKQNEQFASVYKRRKPSESEITQKDLRKKTAKELYNFIRALQDPYPNAYIICKDGKKLYITRAKVQDQN